MNTITDALSATWNIGLNTVSNNIGVAVIWTVVDFTNQSFLSPVVSGLTAPLGMLGSYAYAGVNSMVALMKLNIWASMGGK